MDLEKYKTDNLLIITPNKAKMSLLEKYSDSLINIKYMSKEEYKNHYFFSYDNKTISYLITKYNYNIDVCRTYLDNLYVIDLDKDYKSDKLNFLKKLKQELIDNNLLYFDNNFKAYLSTKKVIVYKYNDLEKYEEEMFKDALIVKDKKNSITSTVTCCKTLEEEILYVIEEIKKLIDKGVSLNNIYLSNIDNEYLYLLKKMFNYFNIPINLDMKESLYGTSIVSNYLKNKKLPSINTRVSLKLLNVINSLVLLEDDPNYNIFLIDKLKHTYLDEIKYKDAINVVSLDNLVLTDNDYLFVMGFNNELIPKTYMDTDYISDKLKDEVNLYKSEEKNIREKESIINTLSNIKNLYLSYKEKSSFNSYLPSTLIDDLGLTIINYTYGGVSNSNIYNKLILGEYLDNYYKYGEMNEKINTLMSTYDIKYNSYDNGFSGIDNSFINYINNMLRISYTSLNNYNNCKFKFYVSHILKLNKFEDTFSIFIGNLYHEIFSKMYNEDFNFEKEWDSYLEKRELTLGELSLLKKLKQKLIDDINIIKEQEKYSTYQNVLAEQEINIKLSKNINVIFTGKIDKIIYKNNVSDTYFSLVDYKTGSVNTTINNMKYGIDMQLPIYLYLLSNSNLFENPIFTGIYFQRVLYPSIKWEKGIDIDKIKKDNLKLNGYSTDNMDTLYSFDNTYEASDYIKSMKLTKNGSFSSYSKVLSDEDIYSILKYTENKVNRTVDDILEGDFSINPKVINNKKSCEHCKFRDLCFVKYNDYVYLDKVDNLDFLEGDTND